MQKKKKKAEEGKANQASLCIIHSLSRWMQTALIQVQKKRFKHEIKYVPRLIYFIKEILACRFFCIADGLLQFYHATWQATRYIPRLSVWGTFVGVLLVFILFSAPLTTSEI